MNWSKIDAGMMAFIVVAWSIDESLKPSALGLPSWLNTLIMVSLGLRMAYFCWCGIARSAA